MKLTEDTKKELEFNEQFTHAYQFLEDSMENVFVTGRAGTGKSTLLQFFRDNTKKNIAVLSPTGVSAVNIKGQTIHSFFRFKPDITPDGVFSIRVRKSQRLVYEKLDAIVIDEISMVRADLLDCIDMFLRRFGKEKASPFGGVQIIFFGDLYQLPPVVTRHERGIFNGTYKSPYFFDAKSFEFLNLRMVELEKIYRQKEEGFVRLLGNIRNKTANFAHLKHLNQRHLPNFKPKDEDFYIYLTTTNAMADQINRVELEQISEESFFSEGVVGGNFEKNGLPTHELLELKEGAQVMLLNNDPNGRWVNGSIGKITFINSYGLGTEPIEVELSTGELVDVMPFTWEMFKFQYNEETESLESESVGSFKQYPMRLAWAVTIHKAQGKTFSKVILDIGRGAFSHGQIYVALSRCTTFEGLILKKPISNRDILLDRRIVEFMENYQSQATTTS